MNTPEATTAPAANPLLVIVESLKNAFLDMGQALADFLPKLVIALIILCIGLILAKIIKAVMTKVLAGIKIDTLVEKSGLLPTLSKMGIKGSLAVSIPKLLGYVIIFFMVKSAAESASFTNVSDFLGSILGLLPKVIMAFLIMVAGMFVGDVIQTATFNSLDQRGLDYAKTLSRIVFGFIFLVFLTVALSQVGIETELLKDSVKILLIGVSMAIAIALGLGLKDHAHNIVAAIYVRDVYNHGTSVEIDGEYLTVCGTGPVTSKLQKENGDFIIIPNSELVSTKIKGRTSN